MKQPIDLRPDHAKIVHEIFARHLPEGVSVRVFGSRAKWTAKPHSDLDLALKGKEPLPSSVLRDLADAFAESDLPFRVDVVDWHTVAPSLQAVIDRDGIAFPWSTVSFASLLSEPVRNGIYKPKEFHGRGCKIVNMGELFAHSRMFDVPMKRVELTPKEQERFLLAPGDLLFARRSLTAEGAGKCSVVLEVREPTTFESSIIRARPDKKKSNSLYLYYFFSSNLGYQALDSIRRQVAVAGITGSDLGNLSIPAPPEVIQTKIADTLSLFDDRIELNRRMNETLEQMAQAIFKDWFVDFGPVRRKQDGARDPIAIMGGLVQDAARASELATLFPETFGDDGLPEGYSLVEVDRFAELRGGKQLNKSEIYENGSIPVFGGAGLMGYTKLSNADGYVITVGRVGAYCGQFFAHRGEAWVNNNASRIICRDPRFSEWLFWALKNLDINAIKKGAAQPFVSNGDIAKLKILFPGEETLVAFLGFLNPLLLLCEAQYSEIKTLSETRDYLLPKLMSGEVRVRDTEKYCLKS